MNVIITGSSGFVGTNFIKMSSSEYYIREVDLLIEEVDKVNFAGIEVVLHLAALVHQMKGAPEEQYFKINRDLAYNMAKRSKEKCVKHFILMSSVKVYGESYNDSIVWDEDSVCNPIDPYGTSKFEAEKLILDLQDDDFKVSIVRSPLVYGIGVKGNMLNLIQLVNRFSILPLGGINNQRSIVYIGNLVALINQIIKAKASGVFIAGDRTSLSTTEIVQLIAKGLKKKIYLINIPFFILKIFKLIFPATMDRLFSSLVVDNTRTNTVLNFIPPYSSEEGIIETVEWFMKR